jgi:dTDP-4-dehydrorhamnose reductase
VRIAVTGAGGRLGRAIVRALEATESHEPLPWTRAEFDLDDPALVNALLDTAGPEVVIHAAAWTDVDGCALDPALAVRRNGEATGVLAAATAARGLDLLVISTNEVFDGEGAPRPYEPADPPAPGNAYGTSKLAGERAAAFAYEAATRAGVGGGRGRLGIARTAWLFGPGAPDFPVKIARAASRAIAAGEPLRIVADEIGTPTYVEDVADAVVAMLGAGAIEGVSHLVNAGTASRADWGRDVLARLELEVEVVEVGLADFPRPSRPPRWGVLAPTPLPSGEGLRSWREAMAAYAPALRQSVNITP